MRRRSFRAIAVMTMAAVAAPWSAPGASAGEPSVPGGDGAERRTVTLVTGDRVHVVSRGADGRSVRVEPGPGRKGMVFFRQTRGDRLSVVPADAASLVAAGRLDAALFDVTGLVEDGYDDAAREDLPLIVAAAPGKRATAPSGTTAVRRLSALNATVVRERKDRAGTFWASLTGGGSGISRVWLDGRVRATLDESVPRIGAPAAWEAGYTGKGVKVGVLDSGIDTGHPDLADAVVEAKDFTGDPDGIRDGNGHGTHVASIITGDGVADRSRRGVAPEAGLVVGKVLDDRASGTFSQVIAGMEWIAGQGVQVVNLSLGTTLASDGSDPLSAAVDALTERTGTLFVVGSGNDGAREGVSVPGVAGSALTVGAVDGDDAVAEFSNSGPRAGDGLIKPDVTAPGVEIVAARAGGGTGDPYVPLSGTSMAAPHVAGAAALLAQRHPGWTAARLKSALMNTARPNGTDVVHRQGAGRVDLARAFSQKVWADQGGVSVHLPDEQTAPVSRKVTFRNEGDAPVTLDLGLTVRGPDGQATADGAVAVSPAEVEVPAGGTADATVTADPAGMATGHHSGRLTASTGGNDVLGMPVGVYKESDLHTVTLSAVDRNGDPAGSTVETLPWVELVDLGTGEPVPTFIRDGRVAARVPSGRYGLNAVVSTPRPDGGIADSTLFSRPSLTVERDVTVTADARSGRRVSVQVDSRTAVQAGWDEAGVTQTIAGLGFAFGITTDDPSSGLYVTPSEQVTQRPYGFYFVATRAEPQGTGPAPRAYHLVQRTEGRIPDDPAFRVHDRELAVLDSRYHADRPLSGLRWTVVTLPAFPFPVGGGTYEADLPGRRIELYTADGDLNWSRDLESFDQDGNPVFTEGAVDPPMAAGRRVVHRWNAATFGPVAGGIRKCGGCPTAFTAQHFVPSRARLQTKDEGQRTITVSRDGQVLGSADAGGVRVVLPPGRAKYTVQATTLRQAGWTGLGTRSQARWTFPYEPSAEGIEEPPIHTMRIHGAFDERNRAPSGTRFRLDIGVEDVRTVTRTPGLSRLTALTLEVSYDDGETWRQAVVGAAGENRWYAHVDHPEDHDGHVSLRLHAEDGADTSVDQTVIRAYGLR